ncbi:hypothetical protein ACX93W_12255 [Paenibacillus sp. CAU 1782]
MKGEKSIKDAKMIMAAALIAGILLLAAGFVVKAVDSTLFNNHKALMALSLLPLSLALSSFMKLFRLKNSPQAMRKTIIKENDERLIALHNEADAKTFKMLQGLLFLTYFGYTFIYPEEIFVSAGWWILLVLLLGSITIQSLLRHLLCRSNSGTEG